MTSLIDISSSPLCSSFDVGDYGLNAGNPLVRELRNLLIRKNGFFAFESALHVFPAATSCASSSLTLWNLPESWRRNYRNLRDETFFAQDVVGNQFYIDEDGVGSFDPEVGRKERLCKTLHEWCDLIMKDYNYLTGYPLAREWQSTNGPLTASCRLIPKIPFFLGGEFAVENLWAGDMLKGMLVRGDVYQKTVHLPDGTAVRLRYDESA